MTSNNRKREPECYVLSLLTNLQSSEDFWVHLSFLSERSACIPSDKILRSLENQEKPEILTD